MAVCLKKTLLTLTLVGLSPLVYADWYSATGSADSSYQSTKEARSEAINDALRNIALQSGANVRLIQNSQNGLLVDDTVNITARSPIKDFKVIEEQRVNKIITVKVRAFVDESEAACPLSNVKKSIVPLAIRYEDNEAYQSSVGIEDFNRELTNMLYSKLASTNAFEMRNVQNVNIRLNSMTSAPDQNDRNNLNSLANQFYSQYILLGSVRSLATSNHGSNEFMKFLSKNTRTINFNIALYDAITGEVILNNNYTGEADYDFSQGEFVDMRSNRFLTSAYGQRLTQLVSDAYDDILATLQCSAPSAKVIDLYNDDIVINIGKSSGLKEDMTFDLTHVAKFNDRQGREYAKTYDAKSKYKVVELYPNSARLAPVSLDHHMINVMLDDIVTLN